MSAINVATITAGSGGIGFLGMSVNNMPEGKKPLIRGHLPFEESFQRWLGGGCKIGKRNFLDDKTGSAVTPVASSILLTVANFSYPRGNRDKDVAQDLFLLASGLFATKGITDISKGIFTRERPYQCILYDSTVTKSTDGHSYSLQSFFSGHSSGAFFSVTFLNLRVRDIMRQRMVRSKYDKWKWVSSGSLFGWASFVGLSRVHAYKHHLSDVVVGAAAGILVAELFYNFNDQSNSLAEDSIKNLFYFTLPF